MFLFQGEIAHQFQLPERQAKVNQLIRTMEQASGGAMTLAEEEEEEEVPMQYCVCRSTDCSRFMM